MKSLRLGSVVVVAFCLFALGFILAPAAQSQADPLPSSGTYFIVSAETKQALQPVAPTVAQNVFLAEYNQSGMQKWVLTRKVDPKTKKPLNRYTIRLAGEQGDLYLQPFPAPDHTCMISNGASDFTLAPIAGSFQLKNVSLNGDALYTYPNPPVETEARFGPASADAKFRWDFIQTN